MKAIMALEDGRIFHGRSFTGPGEAAGEIVFNTSMTGYQEVLTDPSYRGQIVTMTYPLIGNYGVNRHDVESSGIQVAGFVVREYHDTPSNHRAEGSLGDYLKSHGILGVEDIDTRALTRHIRLAGAMRAVISTEDTDAGSLVRRANMIPKMAGLDLAGQAGTATPYTWRDGNPQIMDEEELSEKAEKRKKGRFFVVAIDFGIKYSILRNLVAAGCDVVVVPPTFSKKRILELKPDGVFLSNGPGDPEPLDYAIETIRSLIGAVPIFGICLGHQLLGLALGAKTFKLKFGHRGGNQPVKNLKTGRVEITSQNHGFAVETATLDESELDVTHINLNDNTLEGFRHKRLPLFAVQYHPEAGPGPHDATYLFPEFIKMMAEVSGR